MPIDDRPDAAKLTRSTLMLKDAMQLKALRSAATKKAVRRHLAVGFRHDPLDGLPIGLANASEPPMDGVGGHADAACELDL